MSTNYLSQTHGRTFGLMPSTSCAAGLGLRTGTPWLAALAARNMGCPVPVAWGGEGLRSDLAVDPAASDPRFPGGSRVAAPAGAGRGATRDRTRPGPALQAAPSGNRRTARRAGYGSVSAR